MTLPRAVNARRHLAAAFAGAVMATAATVPAMAEDFPSDTVNVVTHAGPGGGSDITTRMMMRNTADHIGQDFQVVNRRGGSGAAALMYARGQEKDGHTVLLITQSHLFQIAQGKVPVEIDDIVGIARATLDPQIIAVPASSDIKDLKDLVAASKAKEGGLKWGTTFVGGIDHVAIHNFAKKADGMPYTIVPFKGGGDIVTNLVGANVDVASLNYAEGEAQFKAGELRPIAVLAEKRIDSLPDVPTAHEQGIDAEAATIRGFAVLKGVPEERIAVLEEAIVTGMREPGFVEYLQSGGMTEESIVGREEWNAQIRRIYEESRAALEELGLL